RLLDPLHDKFFAPSRNECRRAPLQVNPSASPFTEPKAHKSFQRNRKPGTRFEGVLRETSCLDRKDPSISTRAAAHAQPVADSWRKAQMRRGSPQILTHRTWPQDLALRW